MTSLTRREADLGNSSILGVESIENEDGGFNDSLEHPPATRSQNLVLAPPSNPEAIAASAAAMPTGYRSQFQRMCEGLRNVPSDAKHPPDLWTADAADSQEEGIDEEALEALLESFKSACTNSDDPEDWAPFPDKETFLVAVAALNPRAPMSVGGVQMMLTFARAVGGKNVPSYDRYLKALTALRTMSTGLKQRQGAAGNIFFTVDLHSIVARQFCNPDVRRRLHLYPRRGDVIQHFCDGDIFSAKNVDNNLPSNHVQPMVTLLSGQYAYLHEPVVLSDQRVMVPFVWWEDDEGRILGTANAFSLPIDPECLAFVEGTFTLDPELIDHKATRTLWKQIADQNVYNEQGDDISHMICMPNDLRLEWKGQLCVTLPLIMAIDDWGGGRSKKWDPHHSLLIMLAGLERSDLDQEKNIHLYGASNHATPAELVAAFTQDLQDAAGEFWDCQTNTTIWIRPYLLVVSADNPMAAELAASTGMKANFPCRVCSWGGTNAVKYTSKGVKAMAEGGKIRTPASTIKELDKQLQLAAMDCSDAEIRSRWATTGIKDRQTTECCTILFQRNQELSGKAKKSPHNRSNPLSPSQIQKLMAEEKASLMATDWKSSLLDLHESEQLQFDVHQQMPPEVLHTIILGPLKYLAAITDSTLNDDARDQLQVRLEAVPTDGIECGKTFRASYFLAHLNSLVGRELKALAQVISSAMAPLVEAGSISKHLQHAWLRTAELAKLVWVDSIDRDAMDEYQNELQNRVWAMMEAHARIAPKSILSRPKFHLLIHLGDAIRRYGPASNFATERTESFVAVQRAAVAHTNRMANSRDVAQRLVDQQLLRHLMSGGMRKSLNTGEPSTPCAAIVQVTQSPKNTVFRQRWGLQAAEKEKPKGQAEIMSTGRASATWSLSGERCEVGTFVLYDGADDGGDEDEDDTVPLSVGQIQEVVMQDRSTASVIIRHFEQHQLNKKYNMISIRSTERQVAIKPSEVIGIVNAPHDCIYSRCKIDVEGREVEQERLRTGVSKPSIIHLERGPQRRHLINHTLIRNIPLSFRPRQPQPAANPSSSKDIVKAYELGMQETIEAGAGSGGGRRKRKQKRKRKRTQEDMGDEEEEEEVVNEGAENHDVDVSEEGGEDEEDEEDLAESEPEEDEFDDMDEGY
ncbi:unnamed protein product [Tilletia laevis]|nr:hypothetical protein CF335_g6966 [Tilletia laevis]KAE8247677.1 hypothetical protein A4X03_0g6984 [Tilletia caries]CAD6907379.1 unnamed protein product [Tilletia laevis]